MALMVWHVAGMMRHNEGIMSLYCSDILYSPVMDCNETLHEGHATGGHSTVKFNSETKRFVNIHSKTNAYVKFSIELRGT
jgi:hypothetical protein